MQLYDVVIGIDKNHLNDSRVRAIMQFYRSKPDGFGGKLEVFDTFTDFYNHYKHSVKMRRRLMVLEEINYQELIRLSPNVLEASGDVILLLCNHYKPTKKEEMALLDVWYRAQGTTWELAANQLHRLMGLYIKHDELLNKTDELFYISQKLVSEKDTEKLLEAIRDAGMAIASADAGTLYTIVDAASQRWASYEVGTPTEPFLIRFETARNNSIHLQLKKALMPISAQSVIGSAIQSGKPILIQDTEKIDSTAGYKIDRSFDERTGYKTVSMLTVPFKNRQGKVLGAIQLINKLEDGVMKPFVKADVKLLASLAGQAAVSLENSHLYTSLSALVSDYTDLIKQSQSPKVAAVNGASSPLQDAVIYSPLAMVILDPDMRMIYANGRFSELTQFDQTELIGEKFALLETLKADSKSFATICEVLNKGEKWQGEQRGFTKAGKVFWVSMGLSIVKNTAKAQAVAETMAEVKYWIVVLEDITALKETQLQLIQSEKVAALGQLAAGMAHEMNTPLGFVGSNVQTLANYAQQMGVYLEGVSALSAKDKEVIQMMLKDLPDLTDETQAGLERISVIIKALRTLSHVDGLGGQVAFDLNKSIESALILLEPEYQGVLKIEPHLTANVLIEGNAAEMNQMVLALLKNAIEAVREKHSQEGLVRLSTETKGQNYELCIWDNGVGISDNYLERVCDPFFTTKAVGSGAGLGLSTAKATAEQHGGTLSIRSQLGAFTEVRIRLPLK